MVLPLVTHIFDGVNVDDFAKLLKWLVLDSDGKTILYDGRTEVK